MFTNEEIQILIEGIAAVNQRLVRSKDSITKKKKENLLVGSILEKLNQNVIVNNELNRQIL